MKPTRPISPMCPFGKWLRDRMEERGYTEAYVAKCLGISRPIISYHIRGRRHPDFQTVKRYCHIFDIGDTDQIYDIYELVLRGKDGEEER